MRGPRGRGRGVRGGRARRPLRRRRRDRRRALARRADDPARAGAPPCLPLRPRARGEPGARVRPGLRRRPRSGRARALVLSRPGGRCARASVPAGHGRTRVEATPPGAASTQWRRRFAGRPHTSSVRATQRSDRTGSATSRATCWASSRSSCRAATRRCSRTFASWRTHSAPWRSQPLGDATPPHWRRQVMRASRRDRRRGSTARRGRCRARAHSRRRCTAFL